MSIIVDLMLKANNHSQYAVQRFIIRKKSANSQLALKLSIGMKVVETVSFHTYTHCTLYFRFAVTTVVATSWCVFLRHHLWQMLHTTCTGVFRRLRNNSSLLTRLFFIFLRRIFFIWLRIGQRRFTCYPCFGYIHPELMKLQCVFNTSSWFHHVVTVLQPRVG